MADPVSIIGTVAGLITLAGAAGKHLKITYTTFTEAQSVLESIENEVTSIAIVATELQNCLRSPDGLHELSHVSLVQRSVSETHNTLDKLERELSKLRCANPTTRKWKRSRWLWAKEETNALVQRLQHHKSSLILGLSLLGKYVYHMLHLVVQTSCFDSEIAFLIGSLKTIFKERWRVDTPCWALPYKTSRHLQE